MSHDLSRGDVLLFWAIGVVALLGHRAASIRCRGRWKAARVARPHDRQPDLRGQRSGPTHRRSDPPRLSSGGSFPYARRRTEGGGGHRERHFALPRLRYSKRSCCSSTPSACRMSGGSRDGSSAAVAGHAGPIRNARAIVSAGPRRHRRYGCDRASTRGAVADRAGGQTRDRRRSVGDRPDYLVADSAHRRDCGPARTRPARRCSGRRGMVSTGTRSGSTSSAP